MGVARTLSHIGQAHEALKNWDEAFKYHDEAYELRTRLLGLEHADTAFSLGRLGGVCCKRGDYHKAMEYLNTAYALTENTLGPNNVGTGVAAHNLGGVCLKLGEPGMALNHFRRAVEAFEELHAATGRRHAFHTRAERS